MTQDRLERIRLLSLRFRELQGLRVALAGATITLCVGAYLAIATEPSNNGAIAAVMLSFLLMAPGVFSLNGYYASRFGRQVVSPPRHPRRLVLIPLAYMVVAWTLNAQFPEIPAGGPTLAIVGVASIWMAIRDWPWRA